MSEIKRWYGPNYEDMEECTNSPFPGQATYVLHEDHLAALSSLQARCEAAERWAKAENGCRTMYVKAPPYATLGADEAKAAWIEAGGKP